MIKWHIKYALASILDIMPFKHYLHNKAQKILGGDKLDEEEMLSRAVELFSLTFKFKSSIEQAKVLEIGTGWFPYMPVVAYIYGAKNIITVDLNPWLSNETLRQTIKSILNNSEQLTNNIKLNNTEANKNLIRLKSIYDQDLSFQETLKKLNINYMHGFDVCLLELKDADKIDLVFSSNVLEHIEESALKNIHKHVIKISTDNTLAVHRFNPADHYSYLSGSSISFLTIPDLLWKIYRSGGIAYHNRLRTIEHSEIIQAAGWSKLLWADAVDVKVADRVKNGELRLNHKYKGMSAEEVCAFYSWMVLSKAEANQMLKPKIVSWVNEII
jgi:hypothetical protein